MTIFHVFAFISIVELIVILIATRNTPLVLAKIKNDNIRKANYGIWREWSGSRYVDRRNPNPTKDTDLSAIIRSNSSTGEWEAI